MQHRLTLAYIQLQNFTWKDLKDDIKHLATHSMWTDAGVHVIGSHSFPKHSVKLKSFAEAWSAFGTQPLDLRGLLTNERLTATTAHFREKILDNRRPYVELWDITAPPAVILYRSHEPSQGITPTQAREVERLAQTSVQYVQLPPGYQPQLSQQVMMPTNGIPTPMGTPPGYAAQAVSLTYAAQQMAQAQQAQLQQTYQAYQARHLAAQQQRTASQQYGTTATGLPVNTSHGVAIIEPRKVFVNSLSFRAKESDVSDLFKKAGRVLDVNIQRDSSRKSRGNATVAYGSVHEAQRAIQMFNCHSFMGRDLGVRLDRDTTTVLPPPEPDPRSSGPVIVDGSGRQSRR